MPSPDPFTAADVKPVSPLDPCRHPLDSGYHWDCPRCGEHCYHRIVADIPQTYTTPEQIAAWPLCSACLFVFVRWMATHPSLTP
jgi:hypothetical protein